MRAHQMRNFKKLANNLKVYLKKPKKVQLNALSAKRKKLPKKPRNLSKKRLTKKRPKRLARKKPRSLRKASQRILKTILRRTFSHYFPFRDCKTNCVTDNKLIYYF